MFCYQKNTYDPCAAKCGNKDFWREIRRSSTPWNIDTRRDILRAVAENDEEAKQRWLEHTDYKKFVIRTQKKLSKVGKEKWNKKSDDKKLWRTLWRCGRSCRRMRN